jgi:hypothetical protein
MINAELNVHGVIDDDGATRLPSYLAVKRSFSITVMYKHRIKDGGFLVANT